MSISEKLTIIAENMQRIFDAGYQKGINASGSRITFYVNGSLFTAEAGMTWQDFIYSSYNPTFIDEGCCNEERQHFGTGYNQEDDVYYTNSCCGPAEGIIFSDNGWMTRYEEIQSGGEYFTSNEY